MTIDSTAGPLTEDACWELLATRQVGRLATAVHDEIDIVPVNYVLDGQTVLFRTSAGTKLAELTVNHRVAFEVDDWDDEWAWSVVLKGDAHVVRWDVERERAESLGLETFTPAPKDVWVRLLPEQVSGRRFPRRAED